MAYMRGEFYIYSDGTHLNIYAPEGSTRIPLPIMEELCAMFWARLTPTERENVEHRAALKYGGNIGADDLRAKLGMGTTIDWLNEEIRLEERGESTTTEEAGNR